jgi:hypothetical protein|tara:strand:- start:471 stop:710 length:240 start_codon:yes stop_codon:yes gene_type:complete
MRDLNQSYDDGLLQEDKTYTIGTNDGKEFRSVIYKGTKLFNGKPMMVFKTSGISKEQLTINPSFHTFTITITKENNNNG